MQDESSWWLFGDVSNISGRDSAMNIMNRLPRRFQFTFDK
jgi:hypothetical protein